MRLKIGTLTNDISSKATLLYCEAQETVQSVQKSEKEGALVDIKINLIKTPKNLVIFKLSNDKKLDTKTHSQTFLLQ